MNSVVVSLTSFKLLRLCKNPVSTNFHAVGILIRDVIQTQVLTTIITRSAAMVPSTPLIRILHSKVCPLSFSLPLCSLAHWIIRPVRLELLLFFRCLHVFAKLFAVQLHWMWCDGHSVSFHFDFADWKAIRPELTQASSRKKCFVSVASNCWFGKLLRDMHSKQWKKNHGCILQLTSVTFAIFVFGRVYCFHCGNYIVVTLPMGHKNQFATLVNVNFVFSHIPCEQLAIHCKSFYCWCNWASLYVIRIPVKLVVIRCFWKWYFQIIKWLQNRGGFYLFCGHSRFLLDFADTAE